MRCFARWTEDTITGLCFRDQTILQFGDSWEHLVNIVLLNPGSALPMNNESQTKFLEEKNLPFFIKSSDNEKYFEFKTDPLMKSVISLFETKFDGGTIRLYNLFNLKNQDSKNAKDEMLENFSHLKMFSKDEDIKFGKVPIIIASGQVGGDEILTHQLERHIELANNNKLYALKKIADKTFAFEKTVSKDGFINSYHPSYTFKYGNTTKIGEFKT